jgi:hypothetical protein
MLNISIQTIDHKNHRYPTVGDWYQRDGVLYIKVSKMADWRYEFLVALHELIEVMLCRHDGVTEKSVDRFDIRFEKNRKKGNEDEPGDDPRAPYVRQHCIATGVERIVAALLGVSWKKYGDAINALP